ncbi:hypothetical protein [Micromonospora okii]|uniref:hypothetical protein n=1 Tax=Micromonospora okii TaxID=1182970 RepID=UPI001E2DCB9D|nr:hypothetical protein [Micromonospora okii]
MGKDKKAEKKAAIEKHKAAREHLAEVTSRTRDVNDEYLAANSAVIDAEKNVPWYRR